MTLHICDAWLRCGLWYDGDLIVDLKRLQQRVIGRSQRTARHPCPRSRPAGLRAVLLAVHRFPGHGTVSGIYVRLKLFVHAEGRRADGALVGQVSGLQGHVVIARHVIQQLPLVHLQGKMHDIRIQLCRSQEEDLPFHKLDSVRHPCPYWQPPAWSS